MGIFFFKTFILKMLQMNMTDEPVQSLLVCFLCTLQEDNPAYEAYLTRQL